jgi:superfamily II DNA or RNA helicase
MEYKEEVKHIVTCDARNRFISKLATACTGNTLILFNYVSHGKALFDKINTLVKEGRNVYFIHGGVDSDERERVRQVVDSESDAIILATSSLFSTGTNIPSLENLIFAIPTKSNIRVRQSIGRGLRLKAGKEQCKVFDIADDFRVGKVTNTTYRHMEDRIAIYTSEQFKYKTVSIDLEY